MENLRGFRIKYHGPTNYASSRYSIEDMRHGKRKMLPIDYAISGISEMARGYLESIGIPIKYMAWDEKSMETFLLSENFDIDLV